MNPNIQRMVLLIQSSLSSFNNLENVRLNSYEPGAHTECKLQRSSVGRVGPKSTINFLHWLMSGRFRLFDRVLQFLDIMTQICVCSAVTSLELDFLLQSLGIHLLLMSSTIMRVLFSMNSLRLKSHVVENGVPAVEVITTTTNCIVTEKAAWLPSP